MNATVRIAMEKAAAAKAAKAHKETKVLPAPKATKEKATKGEKVKTPRPKAVKIEKTATVPGFDNRPLVVKVTMWQGKVGEEIFESQDKKAVSAWMRSKMPKKAKLSKAGRQVARAIKSLNRVLVKELSEQSGQTVEKVLEVLAQVLADETKKAEAEAAAPKAETKQAEAK